MFKRITFLLIVLTAYSYLSAQSTTTSDQLAERIAQKMKDTLSLTEGQKGQIVTINKQLAAKKMAAWKLSTEKSTIEGEVQKVENTRDSLYRSVLSEDKFLLYQNKKSTLISNH